MRHINRIALAALFLLSISANSRAADDGFSDAAMGIYQDPGFGVNRDFANGNSSDTIDPFSGALKIVTKDLVVPGNNGLNIEVIRYYQSVTNNINGPYSNSHSARTPYGTGWDINFGRIWLSNTYKMIPSGLNNRVCQIGQTSTNYNPILELPDGTRETLANGDGVNNAYITKNHWIGLCLTAAQNVNNTGGLMVYSPSGLKYTFDLQGTVSPDFQLRSYFVTRIEDPSGNWLSFTYSKTSTNVFGAHHVLKTITASDGRVVTFTYKDETGPLTLLSTITGGGKTIQYNYVDAARSVGAKAQYLTRVTYPDGTGWSYNYLDTATMTGDVPGRYSMTGMQSPQGLSTTYSYYLQQMGTNPAERLNVIASKTEANVRGSTVPNQTWTYQYTKGYAPNNDQTLEVTPTNCIRYTHVGDSSIANGQSNTNVGLWKIGLLYKKEILAKSGASCGAALRTENYTWTTQDVATQSEVRRYNTLVETAFRQPLMSSKVVTQDGANYTTTYAYDNYGQPTSVAEAGQKSRTTTTTYIRPGGLWMLGKVATKTISGIAGNISNTYSAIGKLTQENKYGVVTNYGYLATGDLNTTTDANGHVTRYEDYFRGVPRKVTYADGGTLTRTVNASGTVASSIDAIGRPTIYSYDGMDRVNTVVPPKGSAATISIAYSISASNIVTTLNAGNYSRTREYNQLGQLVKQTEGGSDVASTVTTATYTPDGDKAFVSNPGAGGVTSLGETYSYDALGRLLSATHADNTVSSTSYQSNNTIALTNERNWVTQQSFASYGEPSEQQLLSIIQPGNIVSSTTADNLGRILSNSQGGLTRNYTYNDKGFLSNQTDPETGITQFAYDALGNLTAKSVNGAPTDSYAYDARNRLVTTNYAGTLVASDIYDIAGRLLKQIYPGSAWSYTYDAHDKLLSESLALDSPARNYTFSYAYDASDRMTSMIYPSGKVIDYAPNAYGFATKAGIFANAVAYQPNGALRTLTYGSGRVLNITQDAQRLRPIARTAGTQNLAINFQYTYDATNNLVAAQDLATPSNSQTMVYDSLDRLLTATGIWGTATYAYNERGDITTQTVGTRTLNYAYDPQGRLSTLSGGVAANLSYDAQGHVLQARGIYAYDDAGNLSTLCLKIRSNCGTTPDQLYTYDARGKRLTQTSSTGQKVIDLYGAQGKLLVEETIPVSGSVSTKEYLYAAGEQVAETSPTGTTYYYNDHLGSPVAATDSKGGVLWHAHFRPYGERQETASAHDFGSIGYTGHAHDGDSGLVYAGARYSDPIIGRFLSMDPSPPSAKNAQSFNRYNYANNNPFRYTDPDGREVISADSKNNNAITNMINSKVPGVFSFDKNNKLHIVSGKNNGENSGSSYYQNKLIKAIASKETISIAISKTTQDPDTKQIQDVFFDYGGGLTSGFAKGGRQEVTISGSDYTALQAKDGGYISPTSADTLAHELVGHAIPRIIGSDTGNAITDENKVRSETHDQLRADVPLNHDPE